VIQQRSGTTRQRLKLDHEEGPRNKMDGQTDHNTDNYVDEEYRTGGWNYPPDGNIVRYQ